MGFVANFTCFPVVQNLENRLRSDKTTEFKVMAKTNLRTNCTTSFLVQ